MGVAAGAGDTLAAGQTALDQGDWGQARIGFEQAAASTDSAQAWEGLSRAAWWQGDQEATFAARERAYRGYRAADDVRGAARMAHWIAADHLDFRGDDAVASAWLTRGRALLGDQPPCAELGFILVLGADIALLSRHDPAGAERGAREALRVARACHEIDVEVVALSVLGGALITSGAIEEGLRHLDEGATLAVAEEFHDNASPGWALCHTVAGCAQAGDFARAEQWCRALHTWPSTLFIVAWGGAVARYGAEQSPLAGREAGLIVHPLLLWEEAAEDDRNIRLGRAFRSDMQAFSIGATYPNFLGDEGSRRMATAFGSSADRLAAVKATYDPAGMFRTHQALEAIAEVPTAGV